MSFASAIAFVLEREGGFVNDPKDRGGATKYGITIHTLRRVRGGQPVTVDDVRGLRITEAVAIYERDYWRSSSADEIDAGDRPCLALCVFDAAVNHGPRRAILFLQEALDVSPDGKVGPVTRAAIDRSDEDALVGRYLVIRAQFFRHIVAADPTQLKFLKGWLARCRHVARECGIPIDPTYAST
jgi:lysozyme family protein